MAHAFVIHEATVVERERLHVLLTLAGLSAHAVLAPGTRYWLAETADRQTIGAIGMELGSNAVLLRYRNKGISTALLQETLREAQAAGCSRAYLFSTGAGAYWTRQGFHEVPVPELVAALPDAPQVRRYRALGWLETEVAWRRDL